MGFPFLLKDFWRQGNPLHRNLHVPLTHGALVGLLADLVDLVDPTWGLARSALAEMRETYGNHQIHQVFLVNNHSK